MWKCNKTKRKFDTYRGFLNHLRNQYESIEQAYLYEKRKKEPMCKFCNNKCAFLSFKKGFNDICHDKKCIHKKVTENNRKMALERKKSGKFKKEKYEIKSSPLKDKVSYDDFEIFIKKNIEYYRNNIYETNFLDPFTQ